jgi:O-methyltransferase involved in polyketide biosynthesis
LLDDVTALSAVGSRFAADYLPEGSPPPAGREWALAERWRGQGLAVNLTDLTYPGEHHDAAKYLAAHGWQTVETPLAEVFAATGLPDLQRDDHADVSVSSSYVNAIRT